MQDEQKHGYFLLSQVYAVLLFILPEPTCATLKTTMPLHKKEIIRQQGTLTKSGRAKATHRRKNIIFTVTVLKKTCIIFGEAQGNMVNRAKKRVLLLSVWVDDGGDKQQGGGESGE
jgi:hypothetical protein